MGCTGTGVGGWEGVEDKATREGVVNESTAGVVRAGLAVVGLDFILTAMMFTI